MDPKQLDEMGLSAEEFALPPKPYGVYQSPEIFEDEAPASSQ